jgi:heme oxygenase
LHKVFASSSSEIDAFSSFENGFLSLRVGSNIREELHVTSCADAYVRVWLMDLLADEMA